MQPIFPLIRSPTQQVSMSLVVTSLADATASNFSKLFFKSGYYQSKLYTPLKDPLFTDRDLHLEWRKNILQN